MTFEMKKPKTYITIILIKGQELISIGFLRKEFLKKFVSVVNDSKFINLSPSIFIWYCMKHLESRILD